MMEQKPSAFTVRAFLIGALFAFFVAAGALYGTAYLRGSYMALSTSTIGAVFLLFLLTCLVNPLFKAIHPRLGLNRGELLVVYVMMVMASPIPSFFAGRLLRMVTNLFYYANPQNEWAKYLHPHVPQWLMLRDPEVLEAFYEGVQPGQSIPWQAWFPVLLAWAPFVAASFLVMIAAMSILRRQWVEHERLIFPLVLVPLAMAEEGETGERFGPFYKNPVMWIGFAIPAVWGTLQGLNHYFPDMMLVDPGVDLIHKSLPILDRNSQLLFYFRFNILGFFYFIKTEVAFSMWFFNIFANVLRGLFRMLGVTLAGTPGGGHSVSHPILAYHAMGGMLVLSLAGLWAARDHLKAVFRKALTGDPTVDDSDEILSYRAAVLLLIGGSAVMLGWLWLVGMPVWQGVLLLSIGAILILGYTRVVAESGLSDGSLPVMPAGIAVAAVGSSAIGAGGMVALATTYLWTYAVRSFVMTSAANSLKLGEFMQGNRRPLFWAMVLALVVAIGSSIWVFMVLSHDFGAVHLPVWNVRLGYDHAIRWMRNPLEPHFWGMVHTAIGAGIMMLLMLARWHFVRWPLHPLGYPIGSIWIMDHLWFNMFLAWLIKILVLRYGGVKLYRRTRPFFFGLILGQLAPGGIFLIIDHFTGTSGNVIFWG